MSLVAEKRSQVPGILESLDIDLWMIVEKESGVMSDPVNEYLIDQGATWLSFFVFTRAGHSIAIIGDLEREAFERSGWFDLIIPYRKSPKSGLIKLLDEKNPRTIALNYSVNSPAADGLTHGRYLQVMKILEDTPYRERIISAEDIISQIRGRKTPLEVDYIRRAIEATQDIFEVVTRRTRPGMTEKDVASIIRKERERLGFPPSWAADHNPAVFTGPQETGAHSGPTDRKIQRGHVFNIDAGVKVKGYCSDLQRTWYVCKKGETAPPKEVQEGFRTICQAIRKAFDVLKPGIRGLEVDEIARSHIVNQGYREFPHALGHQVGREAHDGGALLGPEWERYGNLPRIPLFEGQVFTIEPRLYLDDYGVVTVEEMVQITGEGARWLSRPQENIFLIP